MIQGWTHTVLRFLGACVLTVAAALVMASWHGAPIVTVDDNKPVPGHAVQHELVGVLTRMDWPLYPIRDGRAVFTARVGAADVGLSVVALQALPGEAFEIDARDLMGVPVPFVIESDSVRVRRSDDGRLYWVAPTEPGPTAFRIRSVDAGGAIHVNMLVSEPIGSVKRGSLSHYPIGHYQSRPDSRGPEYDPPAGFAPISKDDEDILASPHFTVGQFLCKEPGDPRYLVLSTRLLHKLEMLLGAVRSAGINATTLTVMSGYRTPAYNRKIGNTTSLSRHLYGDAADVFVDNDGDGMMDDLNGDGVSDVADARYLGHIMESAVNGGGTGAYPGGMGAYRANAVHGPFLHVDTRGSRTRW